jgi:hypothetical protein
MPTAIGPEAILPGIKRIPIYGRRRLILLGFLEIIGNKFLLYQKNTLICIQPLNLFISHAKKTISSAV